MTPLAAYQLTSDPQWIGHRSSVICKPLSQHALQGLQAFSHCWKNSCTLGLLSSPRVLKFGFHSVSNSVSNCLGLHGFMGCRRLVTGLSPSMIVVYLVVSAGLSHPFKTQMISSMTHAFWHFNKYNLYSLHCCYLLWASLCVCLYKISNVLDFGHGLQAKLFSAFILKY